MNDSIKKIMVIVILSFMFVFIDVEAACSYESLVQQYGEYAKNSMNETGVYASLTLAQGIQEQGLRANEANNMFGIKMTGSVLLYGKNTFRKDTTDQRTLDQAGADCKAKGGYWKSTFEYSGGKRYDAMSCFKAYDTVEGSFVDHGRWLLNNFANRGAFSAATDLMGQLKALVSNPTAMYATDPNYICQLINHINSCDLTRFDTKPSGKLSTEGCSNIPGSGPSSGEDLEHYGTSYTGDITKGWIYERFEFSETFGNTLPTYKAEGNINEVIDEIFNRAKTSYFSIYGSTDGSGGASYGYSAQACSDLENKTGFGDSSSWKQGYDLWAKIPMGNSNVKAIGCLITSIAIQMDRMGVNTGINNFNPGTFACHLSKNGKFTSGGALYHNWVNLFNDVSLTAGSVTGTKTERATQIQNLINDGCYLVLYAPHSGNSHYVAVSGTTVNDIRIMDPGANFSTLWGSGYYDFGATTSYRCLKKVG